MRFSSIPILFLTTGAIAAQIQDSSTKNPNQVVNRNAKLSSRNLERRNENYWRCVNICIAGGVFGALKFTDITVRDSVHCAGACAAVFGYPE
nr:AVR-Pias [Pyricularia oryzae]